MRDAFQAQRDRDRDDEARRVFQASSPKWSPPRASLARRRSPSISDKISDDGGSDDGSIQESPTGDKQKSTKPAAARTPSPRSNRSSGQGASSSQTQASKQAAPPQASSSSEAKADQRQGASSSQAQAPKPVVPSQVDLVSLNEAIKTRLRCIEEGRNPDQEISTLEIARKVASIVDGDSEAAFGIAKAMASAGRDSNTDPAVRTFKVLKATLSVYGVTLDHGGADDGASHESPEISTRESTTHAAARVSSVDTTAPEQSGSESYRPLPGLTLNELNKDELERGRVAARAFAEKNPDELARVKAANQELTKIHEELQKNPDDPTLQSRKQELEKSVKNSSVYWYYVQRIMDEESARQTAEKEAGECSGEACDGFEYNLVADMESSKCGAQAATCAKNRNEFQATIGLPSGSPPLTARVVAAAKGAWQSVDDTKELVVGLTNLAYNTVKSAVTWQDETGIKEYLGEALKDFWSSLRQPGETQEAYQARIKALEDIKKFQDVYRRSVDGHNCQLSDTKQGSRSFGNVAQPFVVAKIFKGLASIVQLRRGAQAAELAVSLEEAAALQRGRLASEVVTGAKAEQAANTTATGAKATQAADKGKGVGQVASEMVAGAEGGAKALPQFNSVESLIQNAGKLRRLSKGVREGWITGNADDIFIRLANQYGVQIQTGDKGKFFISGNIRVDSGRSSTSNILTLYINNNGRLFKIRIQ